MPVKSASISVLFATTVRKCLSSIRLPVMNITILRLGGGSADAAFMLKLLNDYCGLHILEDSLEELASSIGADCPFFIRNTPVFASGTGNIFETVELSLADYHLSHILSIHSPLPY